MQNPPDMSQRSCSSCQKLEIEVLALVAFQVGFSRGQLQQLFICNECVEEAAQAIACKHKKWREAQIEALTKMQ